MSQAERARELAASINQLYKKEAVTLGSDDRLAVTYQTTGLLPIDCLLGGGIPRGRYTMLKGAYSSLKSYIALNTIAQTQQGGGTAALIDTERTYDPAWAEYLGVDTGSLIVWPPPDGSDHDVTGEKAIDVASLLIRNKIDTLVFDSITAAMPQNDVDKAMSEERSSPGQLGRLMSEGLRRMTAQNSHTAVILTSQIREKVGVSFGNPEIGTGGRAPAFYASHIVDCKPMDRITRQIKMHQGEKWSDAKETTGRRMKFVLEKSKLSRPWRDMVFVWSLEHNEIDMGVWFFTQGVDLGFIEQKGSRWIAGETSINGRENMIQALRENADLIVPLENKIREAYGLPSVALPGESVTAKSEDANTSGTPSKRRVPKPTQEADQGE